MTVTATAASDPDDWYDTFGRQKAYDAARRIAEREAQAAANVDPATEEAFDAEVRRRTEELLSVLGEHLPPNPLAPYLVDWAEFWVTEHDETEWLLEPLFADGRAHALYAGAKTGKSYLILAACAAMATGRGFLLQPRGTPVPILYLDYEMSPADVRERLEEFGYGPSDDLSALHYALLPSLPPLDTDEGGQALLEAALAVGARFVIIDTTSRAIQGDENDADTLRAFYRYTGLRLKQAGIGWMRLDHAGKDAAKGQRGTSAKNDDVDVVARIERTDGGQRWLATHRRMAWYPEKVEIAVTPGDDGTTRFTMPEGEMWPAGTSDLAAELDRIGVPVEATVRHAREAMKEAGVSGATTVLAKALKWRRQEAQRVADEAAEALSESITRKARKPVDNPVDSGAEHAAEQDLAQGRNAPTGTNGTPPDSRAEHAAERSGTESDATAEQRAYYGVVRTRSSVTPPVVDDVADEPDGGWF